MRKVGVDDGGLNIAGLTEEYQGLVAQGIATNTDTSTNTTSIAALELRGWEKSGTSVTAMGDTDNVIALRNGTTTRWILKGDGDTYQDGDMYDAQNFTPDIYDDVALVRATMLLSPDAIRTDYDDSVQYTRKDLEEIGLIKGEHRNRSKQTATNSGAIWQLHQRIADLEKMVKDMGNG